MNSRREVPVKEFMELIRRPVTPDPTKEYVEIGVRSFGRGIFHKEPVTGATLGSKRVFEIHGDELVFNNVFAWEGAVATTSHEEEGAIGSHRFMTYQVDPGIADLRYLSYFFQSDPGLKAVRAASPGSAGRNRTLGIKAFAEQSVPLPQLEEQRRIAAKLDRALKHGNVLAKRYDDEHVANVKALYTGFVDQVTTGSDVTTARVGDVAQLVNDLVRPGEDPRPANEFIGLENIEGHLGVCAGSRALGDEGGRKFRFEPDDILYGYLRPYQNKVWNADRHGLCSVEQYVLRCDRKADARFLGHLLRGRNVLSEVNNLTNNLQLPRLRSSLLLDLEVPWPRQTVRVNLLPRLDGACAFAHRAVSLISKQQRRALALRPALLNAAFSGEL